ncbi:hypothetical protein PACTADRAFT_31091 [Pachysolen tannophilus NRRL Y-2460]|uniref:GPI transamidase component GPI17 n=1 Tax=Pachysolen tannophilus NRRL Y-2460 TaxID=669874 RepID=A0A1E4U0X5_PACTA|nr:hypothetical protein PACTADRAFT_31091 [Pachysolen tannophilus NRRL Y-2460]
MPESYPEFLKRIKVFSIFFFYSILIGIPIWLNTTSIEKRELPVNKLQELEEAFKIDFDIPIILSFMGTDFDESLINETQVLIDEELGKFNNGGLISYHLQLKTADATLEEDLQTDEHHCELYLEKSEDEDRVFVSPFTKKMNLYVSEATRVNGNTSKFISNFLIHDLFKDEIDTLLKSEKNFEANKEEENFTRSGSASESGSGTEIDDLLTISYSPHYKLVFNLINEDGVKIGWDIEHSVEKYFKNLVAQLDRYADFSIDTNIQYYCDLNIDESGLTPSDNEAGFLLTNKELSTFINYNDWNLNNNGFNDYSQVINFIVYIPRGDRPLFIENSKSNSFIIPKWGSIQLLNLNKLKKDFLDEVDLLPILENFSSELFSLLGIPVKSASKNLSINIEFKMRSIIVSNLLNTFKNLSNLVKLTKNLKNISIPMETLVNFEKSLKYYETTIEFLNDSKFNKALKASSLALYNSDQAFFDKNMIQQVYFPDEHKLAVYTPLIGPILTTMALSLIKCLKDFRKIKQDIHDKKKK